MTSVRIVVAGGTVAVTRRTMFRKLFWTPSSPLVHQGYLYALADAQQKYGVEVHHGALMPTHAHLSLTPREANLPLVLRHLHRETARFCQAHMLAHGYDAPDNVWDKRSTNVMRLLGSGAQLEWLLYSHLNPVAAGLVERVEQYPGWASDLGLLKGGVVGVKKPPLYYGKRKSGELPLTFTPLPALGRAFDGDGDAMVHWLRRTAREMENGYRDQRRASGARVVGAARVRGIHPWAEPRTAREPRGERIPTFKIGELGELADDAERRDLVLRCVAEGAEFVRAHGACRERWRDGDREVVFPAGTYNMRVEHGVAVAEPSPDAMLCVGDAEPSSLAIPADQRKTLLGQIARRVMDAGQPPNLALSGITDAGEPAGDAPSDPPAGAPPAPVPGEEAAPSRPARPPAHGVPLEAPSATATVEHPRRVVSLRTRRERDPP